ncbi:hypothetical protein BHM03_00003076 [Ensete ventricosum]|uniref:Uncharacterized protein n=1 Tax=Ensete ventricosum TaxID=4639 RepID=A0A427B450_ENSVE|nr:hypothetical protein B296_00000419 [Ensete ventricosum]RZR77868.1 hypothetical protein BHM03_00003076 [Ensete ventricosum]
MSPAQGLCVLCHGGIAVSSRIHTRPPMFHRIWSVRKSKISSSKWVLRRCQQITLSKAVPSDRRHEFQFSDYTLNLIGTIMIYMTRCDYKFSSLQIMYVLPSWFAGLICDHGLTLGDLIGVLEDFFARLGMISYLTT